MHRLPDAGQRILVYLAWSTRLVDGSPCDAIATIAYR